MGYIIGFLIFLLLVSGLMIWFKNREIDNLWIEARSHKKLAVNAVNFFRIADALRKEGLSVQYEFSNQVSKFSYLGSEMALSARFVTSGDCHSRCVIKFRTTSDSSIEIVLRFSESCYAGDISKLFSANRTDTLPVEILRKMEDVALCGADLPNATMEFGNDLMAPNEIQTLAVRIRTALSVYEGLWRENQESIRGAIESQSNCFTVLRDLSARISDSGSDLTEPA